MLHILLTILKIIGITLLILIGIILTLLLLILFVPIRYRVRGQKDDVTMTARCKVTWLFGFLTFWFLCEDQVTQKKLKVLGIDLFHVIEKCKQKKKLKKKKLEKKKNTGSTDKCDKIADTKEKHSDAEHKTSEMMDSSADDSSIEEKESKKVSKKTLSERIRAVLEKIKSLPSLLKEKFQKIKLTIANIYDKIDYWKEFLSDDRTKAALILVKDHLIKLVKHIFPKKISGNVTFGFEDPYQTGQVLAGVSVIYPWYAEHLNICPDFTKKVLIGDLDLKGRVYLFYVLKSALVIFFNKNIQYVIHIFRNKEES